MLLRVAMAQQSEFSLQALKPLLKAIQTATGLRKHEEVNVSIQERGGSREEEISLGLSSEPKRTFRCLEIMNLHCRNLRPVWVQPFGGEASSP